MECDDEPVDEEDQHEGFLAAVNCPLEEVRLVPGHVLKAVEWVDVRSGQQDDLPVLREEVRQARHVVQPFEGIHHRRKSRLHLS